MPEGAVSVTRPGKWGNPWRISETMTATAALELYQMGLRREPVEFFEALRGKDLACWCRLCEAHKDGKPMGVECPDCDPCHADVLLQMANS